MKEPTPATEDYQAGPSLSQSFCRISPKAVEENDDPNIRHNIWMSYFTQISETYGLQIIN